jgi:hypothetical protein
MKAIARRYLVLGITAGTLALASSTAWAGSSKEFWAKLDGASEVPPKTAPGTGMAAVRLEESSKTLSWEITYSALTGDATAAHFHDPAAAGANAGVAVPITVSASPIKGSVVLTDAQIAELSAGRWYVNIHTAANGGGEIRGQVLAK